MSSELYQLPDKNSGVTVGRARRLLCRTRKARKILTVSFAAATFVPAKCFAASPTFIPVLSPDGPIARAERDLLFIAFGLMLIVAIPVFVMAIWFPLKYRASNKNAEYQPDWGTSRKIELMTWIVPMLLVVAIGVLQWVYTHKLDPYRRIDRVGLPPLEVQVVALDWKWLFLYPKERVASVNSLVVPSGVPIRFRITSDTVMNSFSIPALSGQIYAMAGMQTQLHVIADKPGNFEGRNLQYSGAGFSGQHFTVQVLKSEAFYAWVAKCKQSSSHLDLATYSVLARPSKDNAPKLYASYEPGLFQHIIEKYMPAANKSQHTKKLPEEKLLHAR